MAFNSASAMAFMPLSPGWLATPACLKFRSERAKFDSSGAWQRFTASLTLSLKDLMDAVSLS